MVESWITGSQSRSTPPIKGQPEECGSIPIFLIFMDTTALQTNQDSRLDGALRPGASTRPAPGGPSPRTAGGHGRRLSRFVFTLNNWTQQEYDDVCAIEVRWLVVAKETGDEGTPHLQGACVIGKQMAFTTLKKIPGFARAHIEAMRGKPEHSLAYCSKQDPLPFQKGEMPKEGKRNDLHDAIAALKDGNTIQSIVRDGEISTIACIARYPKGLQMISSMLKPRRSEPPLVCWLSGSTGIGKTRSAVELAESISPDNYWISAGSLRWFDGYDGQPVVIFDDLRTKHAEFSFLLRLLDRYALRVEFKGGFVDWTPLVIIVTGPKTPENMWSLRNDEDKQQLRRRVTLCYDAVDGDDHQSILTMLRDSVDERWPGNRYPWSTCVEEQSAPDLEVESQSVSMSVSEDHGNLSPVQVKLEQMAQPSKQCFIDLTGEPESNDESVSWSDDSIGSDCEMSFLNKPVKPMTESYAITFGP